MRRLALALMIVFAAGGALAQQGKKHDGRSRPQQGQNMSREDRDRMREDMREVYRERGGRQERPRQMSPADREKLRQDVQDANRGLKR